MTEGRFGQLVGEWLRFGLVGVTATLTYMAASLAARASGLGPYASNLAGYLASVGVSYLGHALFTFRSNGPHAVQIPKFAIQSLLVFGATNAIVWLVVEGLGLPFSIATLIVAVSIPVLTWLSARFWVFTPGRA